MTPKDPPTQNEKKKKRTQSRLMVMEWPTSQVSPFMIMIVMIIMNTWMKDEQSPVLELDPYTG